MVVIGCIPIFKWAEMAVEGRLEKKTKLNSYWLLIFQVMLIDLIENVNTMILTRPLKTFNSQRCVGWLGWG